MFKMIFRILTILVIVIGALLSVVFVSHVTSPKAKPGSISHRIESANITPPKMPLDQPHFDEDDILLPAVEPMYLPDPATPDTNVVLPSETIIESEPSPEIEEILTPETVKPVEVSPDPTLPEDETLLLDKAQDQIAVITAPPLSRTRQARIALVIDDLGFNANTKDIISLPKAVTTAFLPDAPHTPELAKLAHEGGHEIIIHMPMEAMDYEKEEPSILRVSMSKDEVSARLDEAFSRVPHAIGLNNHTGSKYTSDMEALLKVMSYLKAHDKLFLDSKTIASSKGDAVAQVLNMNILSRDVFIDHVVDPEMISKSLLLAEQKAQRNGSVIVIGHPYKETIEALQQWLPTLEGKNIELVPLSQLWKREQRSDLESANLTIVRQQ